MDFQVIVVKGFRFIHTDFSPFEAGMILASFVFLSDAIDFCRGYQLRYGSYFAADEGLKIVQSNNSNLEVCSFLGPWI